MKLMTSVTNLSKVQWMIPKITFPLIDLPSYLMNPNNGPTFQNLIIYSRMIHSPRKVKTPIFPTLKKVSSHTRLTNRPSMVVSVYTTMPLNVLIIFYTAAGEDRIEALPSLGKEIKRLSPIAQPFIFPKLPFNLLQTDEENIRLFRDISYNTSRNSNIYVPSPDIHLGLVVCTEALYQEDSPAYTFSLEYHLLERLNMMAQIPELGIVLIGNQAGRVGILTMTRWAEKQQSAFKIEAIVPSMEEEIRGVRPGKPLMGMAVGPMQGLERPLPGESSRGFCDGGRGRGGGRRFRLLMMYTDHTVLSYEIWREEEEEGVDDVLVV